MREGTVVYLAGAKEIPENIDVLSELARAGLDPAWTEVAASLAGYHTVSRAALELAKRGAGRIAFASAFMEGGVLALSASRARLAG